MSRRARAAVCLLGLALAGCASAVVKKADPATLRDLTSPERVFLASKFSRSMKDPGAAQFQWGKIGPPNDKGTAWYCGKVNGKNSYGGYVGFQVFEAVVKFNGPKIVDGTVTSLGSDPSQESVIRDWCEAEGLDVSAAN